MGEILVGLQRKLVNKIMKDISKGNYNSINQFLNVTDTIVPQHKDVTDSVRDLIKRDHPSLGLVKRIVNDIDPRCRDKFIENFVIRGLIGNSKKKEKTLKQGSYCPTVMLVSPTMRCNLKCIGCYASNYTMNDEMDPNTLDRLIKEGKDMGVTFFIFLGGEPFVYKPMFDIIEKHKDAYFQVYTNGTLINQQTVERIKKAGNILPIISIEGYEDLTDQRRGKGVYKKVMNAMDLMKKNRVPFGYSVAVTKMNASLVMSDEFIDFIIKKGAFVGWYFSYMPVGGCPDLGLMPTPKQRLQMLKNVNHIRETKPLFVVDFWNDAPYVKGCIAGKEYVHITHKGDVEPCIFTHFATDNINKKSLKQAMASPFFKRLRHLQPYNKNLYLPCMWIDNPEISRKIIKQYKAYPTHEGADKILVDKDLRKGIDKYSKEVKRLYKKVWDDQQKREKLAKAKSKK